jgi:polynucleotide 5'-hydroxyl-kinase GRC3/NOL9
VSEPLLGPNFTHLAVKKEVNLFLGSVDVSSVKDRYLKAMAELPRHQCTDDIPCIINTMGFTEGLGVHLMKKAAEVFRPTTIVEIESRQVDPGRFYKAFFAEIYGQKVAITSL